MTETPAEYSTQSHPEVQLTVEQMRSQCHQLIETISRRPGAAKLLLGLLPLLKLNYMQVTSNGDHESLGTVQIN